MRNLMKWMFIFVMFVFGVAFVVAGDVYAKSPYGTTQSHSVWNVPSTKKLSFQDLAKSMMFSGPNYRFQVPQAQMVKISRRIKEWVDGGCPGAKSRVRGVDAWSIFPRDPSAQVIYQDASLIGIDGEALILKCIQAEKERGFQEKLKSITKKFEGRISQLEAQISRFSHLKAEFEKFKRYEPELLELERRRKRKAERAKRREERRARRKKRKELEAEQERQRALKAERFFQENCPGKSKFGYSNSDCMIP